MEKHYDIYSKCEECGNENWTECFATEEFKPIVGDDDYEYCMKCKKDTLHTITEVVEDDAGEEDQ